jgi:hypothetical protein
LRSKRTNMGIEETNNYTGRLDKVGVVASWLCLAHCLGLPLSAVYVLRNETAEWAILAGTAAIGLAALVPAYFRHHRRSASLALFAAGIALIAIAEPLFEDSLPGRAALLFAGAAGITGSHLLNLHLCRRCSVCCSGVDRS